jgi:hypothetical protein
MDTPRKIGIGIVMLVPTFVGCGAIYAIFHNLFPPLIWIVLMAFVYRAILNGKLNRLLGSRA